VNSALVLLTACLAGADPVQDKPKDKEPLGPPTAGPTAPAPTYSAPYGGYGGYGGAGDAGGCGCSSGGDSCGCGCGGKAGLFDRWRGMFSGWGHSSCNTSSSCGCETHRFHHQTSCGCEDSCGKASWFDRLRSRFHKGNECGCDTCGGCGGGGGGLPAEPYPTTPRMPSAGEKLDKPTETKPTTMSRPLPQAPDVAPVSGNSDKEAKNPFELDRRYEKRVDRAADFSWLTGQLFYVHADGGLWVLRYAPLSTEDANGGGVVLARDVSMDNYREGDLVTIHGEILRPRGSIFLGAPLYRVRSIKLIDRGVKP
jgi:hypothetical protein